MTAIMAPTRLDFNILEVINPKLHTRPQELIQADDITLGRSSSDGIQNRSPASVHVIDSIVSFRLHLVVSFYNFATAYAHNSVHLSRGKGPERLEYLCYDLTIIIS